MQKLGFQLYEVEFFTKQTTPPPPSQDSSDLTRPFPSISSSLFITVLPSLVSLNPLTIAFLV